ncbi:hypothetical protein J6590_095888 [Homalodisca vitripennis]|nr:hypothetical protein J6590_095888 [Homalodisca vitripennis]
MKLSFSDEYEKVNLNHTIESASKNTKNLKTRKTKRVGNISSLILKNAYKTKLPISDRKKKSLMDLVKKQTIPKFYSSFYEKL